MRMKQQNGMLFLDSLTIAGPLKAVLIAAIFCLIIMAPSQDLHAEGELPRFDRVRILDKPRIIADAELTNQAGESFKISDLGNGAPPSITP